MSNTEVLRPTTPQEWAARLGVPMASSTGSVASDMGGVRYTPAPRMTPEQQARADELERFKMREQIYRGERPTTIVEDAQARIAGGMPSEVQRRDQSSSGSSPGASSPRAQPAATQRKEYLDIRYYLWITMPGKATDASMHACFTSTARSLTVPADLPNLGTPGDINSLIAADLDSFLSRCARARHETAPLRRDRVQIITAYKESDFAMLDREIAEWSRDPRRATSVQ